MLKKKRFQNEFEFQFIIQNKLDWATGNIQPAIVRSHQFEKEAEMRTKMFPTFGSFISFFCRAFRIRDKILILLILVFVCFGGGFTISNSFEPGGKVREVYTKIQKAESVTEPNFQLGHRQPDIDVKHANYISNDVHGNLNDDLAASNADHLKKSQAIELLVINSLLSEDKNVNSNGAGEADAEERLPKGEDSDPIARDRQNKIREVRLVLCTFVLATKKQMASFDIEVSVRTLIRFHADKDFAVIINYIFY